MDAVEYITARQEFCVAHLRAKLCGGGVKRRDKVCCPFWAKSAHKPFCALRVDEEIYTENTVKIIEDWVNGQSNKEQEKG